MKIWTLFNKEMGDAEKFTRPNTMARKRTHFNQDSNTRVICLNKTKNKNNGLLILALRRQRQAQFKAILVYITSSKLAGLHKETLSQKQNITALAIHWRA